MLPPARRKIYCVSVWAETKCRYLLAWLSALLSLPIDFDRQTRDLPLLVYIRVHRVRHVYALLSAWRTLQDGRQWTHDFPFNFCKPLSFLYTVEVLSRDELRHSAFTAFWLSQKCTDSEDASIRLSPRKLTPLN